MHLNNDYISRYRSVPAASYTAELSDRMIPYLPYCDGHEGLFLSTPMHYHPEAEIIFVERGEWQYRCAASDDYRTAHIGDVVIFPPYEPHETAIRAESGGYVTHCICFDTELISALPIKEAADFLHLLSLSDKMHALHIPREHDTHQRLDTSFHEMLDALDAPGHCEELLFYGALCFFFGHLRRIASPHMVSSTARDGMEQSFARAVINFTETHYAEPISTRTTAAALNYSEPYFCRMFRRVFQMCYSDYLNRLRISKVYPLLETMSVTDAAVACGFTHMSGFSKTFRRCTGMSPTEYRQTMRRTAEILPTVSQDTEV
jgi:AraC-like DNA-binding protein